MSVVKPSQIHDGFATIRSRGLQRSRSRVEQLERLKPISSKSDSMPLYENNNNHINGSDIVYSFENGGLNDRLPIVHQATTADAQLRPFDDVFDDKRLANLSTAFASFKSSNGCLNEQDNYCEVSKSRTSLPPPSPCYENISNGFHTPKTPDSMKSNEYFLYSRPTSPLYERFTVGLRESSSVSPDAAGVAAATAATVATADLYSSPSKVFTPTYYRKAMDASDYALHKVTAKPPINFKSQSLQYRKSYSHPAQTIYETSYTVKPKVERNNVKHYYNPSTNYYDPSEMGYTTGGYNRKRNTSTEMISDASSITSSMAAASMLSSPRLNALERRYATLAHPKDRLHNRQQYRQQQKLASNAHSVSQSDIDYLDPLDFKVGCQTTLRSKPQIPWYELAIKKDHRRQSCPPFQVII